MQKKKLFENLFILLYDILLFLFVLLCGILIIEIVLPGLTAHIVRIFDIIILLSLNVFSLFWISQQISIPKKEKSAHRAPSHIITAALFILTLAAFFSATYKYEFFEILILMVTTYVIGHLFYTLFLSTQET